MATTNATGKPGATTFTTPSDREVRITRVFDAPRRLVWDAMTDPKHLPHWMLGPEGWTMPVCEVDLRPGGKYRYVWRKSGGSDMTIVGVTKEVSPPERLVQTESWGAEWPETVNEIALTEHGGRTTMALTILYPSKEARDAALQTGMKDGVEVSYNRLDEYLKKLA